MEAALQEVEPSGCECEYFWLIILDIGNIHVDSVPLDGTWPFTLGIYIVGSIKYASCFIIPFFSNGKWGRRSALSCMFRRRT